MTIADAPASSPQCLVGNLGWLLSQADHVLATEIAAALSPLGLGSRGYCVLATAMQGQMTQTELAHAIGLDKTTMVVTVDELERAGLAERRSSSSDRRARVVAVTKKGERKVAEAQQIIERVQDSVLSALPARERDAFVHALTTLATGRLSEAVECSPPLRRREPRA
jgi:MarR family transcriptional regulator, transcriptional regulator for hemolysin